MKRIILAFFILFVINSCSTYKNLQNNPSKPFGGIEVNRDINTNCYYIDCLFVVIAMPIIWIDLGFSTVADVATLPYTIPDQLLYERKVKPLLGYYTNPDNSPCEISINLQENNSAFFNRQDEFMYRHNQRTTPRVHFCKNLDTEHYTCKHYIWEYRDNLVVLTRNNDSRESEYVFRPTKNFENLLYLGIKDKNPNATLSYISGSKESCFKNETLTRI